MRAWRIIKSVLAYMLALLLLATGGAFCFSAAHAHGHYSHADGNAKSHLVQNNGAWSVGYFGSNFNPSVNRPGLHHYGFWGCHVSTLVIKHIMVVKLTFRGQ